MPNEDNYNYELALVRRIAQRIFAMTKPSSQWQHSPNLAQQRVQDRYENLARDVIREVRKQAG